MAVKKQPAKAQPAKPQPSVKPQAVPQARPVRDLDRLIAEEAYYRAQSRGFEPGHELEDWIAAEKEVRRRIEGAT
jgi:hypothetical protein